MYHDLYIDKKKLFNAPESASTVMEALEQRLNKYKEAEAQAKEEGNTSKASRQGRIVKVRPADWKGLLK